MHDTGAGGTHDVPFGAGDRHAAEADTRATGDTPIERGALLAEVARDARLDRKFLLLITLAAAVATLGLLQDSPAVVIGAMLISPLLGPIMGLGFGIATIEPVLIRRSLVTLAAGVALAIGIAMLIIWLSPIQDVTDELRARTQPTLLDLAVAIVGGVAGVYAVMRNWAGVMVGVAIATALVPPIATIGFGIVTGRPEMAGGAALLFLTNTLAIALSATVVARLNRFGPSLTPQHSALQATAIFVVLGLLAVPLALSLNGIVREVRARNVVQTALDGAIGENGRVDSLSVDAKGEMVRVDAVILIDQFDPGLRARLRNQMTRELRRPVEFALAQLRRESVNGAEQQDSLNQRITALERRDSDNRAIVAALTFGGLIDRERVTVDPQVRRILISRDADGVAPEVIAAEDRIIASTRASFADWVIAVTQVSPPPDN